MTDNFDYNDERSSRHTRMKHHSYVSDISLHRSSSVDLSTGNDKSSSFVPSNLHSNNDNSRTSSVNMEYDTYYRVEYDERMTDSNLSAIVDNSNNDNISSTLNVSSDRLFSGIASVLQFSDSCKLSSKPISSLTISLESSTLPHEKVESKIPDVHSSLIKNPNDLSVATSLATSLSSHYLLKPEPPEDTGFHTPKEGFTYSAFSSVPVDKLVDSAASSFEEKKSHCPSTVTGKRSSPNDVTCVPERNRSDSECRDLASPLIGAGDGDASPSRLYTEYNIESVIGKGIFGTVYKVTSKRDGSSSAVKRSRRQYRSAYEKNKMLREVDAMQMLSKSEDLDSIATIVKYKSYWVEDYHVCIQMELCDMSVENMLSLSLTFSDQEAIKLLNDILLALATLHRNDFVHLDIKPANIMKKGDRFKLGDFGLAVHTNHGQAASNAIEEGDCRYMANELLDWGPVADLTKCDIFSLGVTGYEIVTNLPTPLNGPQWHALRNGSYSLQSNNLTNQSIPETTKLLLKDLLNPSQQDRPTAFDCLRRYFNTDGTENKSSKLSI